MVKGLVTQVQWNSQLGLERPNCVAAPKVVPAVKLPNSSQWSPGVLIGSSPEVSSRVQQVYLLFDLEACISNPPKHELVQRHYKWEVNIHQCRWSETTYVIRSSKCISRIWGYTRVARRKSSCL